MIYCVYIAVFLLWVYILMYSYKHDIPYCLSVTYYGTKYKCMFPIFMLAQVALIGMPMLDATPDRWQFLCFLLVVCLTGVAVTPFRDDAFKYKIHYVCSLMAMACVCALHIIAGTWPLVPIVVGISLLVPIITYGMSLREYWLLCLELAMFHLAYLYLILQH